MSTRKIEPIDPWHYEWSRMMIEEKIEELRAKIDEIIRILNQEES